MGEGERDWAGGNRALVEISEFELLFSHVSGDVKWAI